MGGLPGEFRKVSWYFFISFAEGVFWENLKSIIVIFLISLAEEVRISKKRGGGGLPGKFRKGPWYFFVLSFSKGVSGWVVNLKKFEKSAYVPSKSTCTPACPLKITL